MPKTRQQKEQSVADLTDKLSKAKSVIFTNYQGMTMSQLSDLRKTLREQNAEFSITKNNLLNLALKNSQLDLADDAVLTGATATLFSFEDEILPLKTVTKAFKDNQVGELKGGLLNGEALSAAKVTQLSTLPSKDELRGKVVGTLGAPLYGIVGVLQGNLRNLVYALDQIRISKGGESR